MLLFSRIYPEEPTYEEYFLKEWDYVNRFLLDHTYGDWFEGGLDQEPHHRMGPKSHMWKCTYHTGRALMNCITLLSDGRGEKVVPEQKRRDMEELIRHWRTVKTVMADAPQK